jgi:hypothetical protein
MQLFVHRLFSFRPCKPRNPLLRLACGLMGLAVLVLLVVFGLFIGLGMLLFAAARRLSRPTAPAAAPAAAPADPNAIEGEYTVVAKANEPTLSLR